MTYKAMMHRWVVAGIWLGIGSASGLAVDKPWRQYASPEEAGWSSGKLEECRKVAEKIDSAAVLVVYRGHVLAAWGEVERRFKCHSVRKSLLSALYGAYVTSGVIDIQKTLAALRIDDLSPLSDTEKRARIVDLLRARSGIYHPAAKEPRDMKSNRPRRGSAKPGERFWYNNWDFNTLGVIFEQESGERVFEAFELRLATPLGMEDFRLKDTLYELAPSSSKHPAHAFRMSARDLARVGQLFLQRGKWDGRQLIPEAWIRESTKMHSDAGGGRGYGYMWWVYPAGGFAAAANLKRLNAVDKFAAVGTGGQMIMVLPKEELVIVHRGDADNDRKVPGGEIWRLAEQIVGAKNGEAVKRPRLTPLTPIPFANPSPPPVERTEIAIDAAALDDYLGEYEQLGTESSGLRVRVHAYEGRLFARAAGVGEIELFGEGADRFFSKAQDVQMVFQRDEEGYVNGATAIQRGRPMRFKKSR